MPPPVWDEVEHADAEAASVYASLLKRAGAWGREDHERLQAKSRKLMSDLGVTHPQQLDSPQGDHVLPFDLIPRVISRKEWVHLREGAAQRLRIWNAFLRDMYRQQEALKANILPFQLVYDDPAYLRPAFGLARADEHCVRLAAFDLARDASGRWVVVQDHVSDFTGPGYALQARNLLSSVCPELLEAATPKGLQGFTAELLDHVQGEVSGRASEPRVVMLTPTGDHPASFEHTLMARMMGIPLVRAGDLTVLNSRVLLRTIGGLEPIDVIYRRVEEAGLDPLAFRSDSRDGVPGLLNCVRKGSVTVVNGFGTGLGNNHAISAMLGRLAKFYFNEPLKLPTVERVWCRDRDQLEVVLGQLDCYRLRHVSDRSPGWSFTPASMLPEAVDDLRKRLQATSGMFVAERLMPLALLPMLGPRGLEKRHAGLRLFAWSGEAGRQPPLALTRYATEPGSRIISSGESGGIKDTWVLGAETETASESPIQVFSPQRRLRLASRIADSLYWMGRYESRAESTSRILRVLLQLKTEEHGRQQARQWSALWEALARATGHQTHFFQRSPRFRRQTVADYLLFDTRNTSSIINAARQLRHNAQMSRESIPPELWMVINGLYRTLEGAREQATKSAGPTAAADLLESVLQQMNALTGAAAKNMLRDDGWHFWNMGLLIERGLSTILVTRQVLMKRPDTEGQSPRRDESNLDALLRMLACQYAYRSLFQSRPVFRHVASLVLQDPQLPRSVLFCLSGVREALESVFGNRFNPLDRPETLPPLRHCSQLISDVEFTDLSPYFLESAPGKTGRLRQWLDGLASQVLELANNISDHYLHHQNFRMLV